jgi:hypothetical protein
MHRWSRQERQQESSDDAGDGSRHTREDCVIANALNIGMLSADGWMLTSAVREQVM